MAWRWVDKTLLTTLHDESLAMHGGATGMRDEALLDSALNRASNLAHNSASGYADLAVAYGAGLAKNHAFVDGNKRVAFLSVGLFLALNGYKLTATRVDATLTMLDVAAGEMEDAEFAAWIKKNTAKK